MAQQKSQKLIVGGKGALQSTTKTPILAGMDEKHCYTELNAQCHHGLGHICTELLHGRNSIAVPIEKNFSMGNPLLSHPSIQFC